MLFDELIEAVEKRAEEVNETEEIEIAISEINEKTIDEKLDNEIKTLDDMVEFFEEDNKINYVNLFSYLWESRETQKEDYNYYTAEDSSDSKAIDYENITEIETISIETVDKIIEEKKIKDLLGIETFSIKPEDKEVWQYYRLFNDALIKIKYAIGFS